MSLQERLIALYGEEWSKTLPLGKVLATAKLTGVRQVEKLLSNDPYAVLAGGRVERADNMGDFGLGRWLWFFGDVIKLDDPIPARGKQKLWHWQMNGELETDEEEC